MFSDELKNISWEETTQRIASMTANFAFLETAMTNDFKFSNYRWTPCNSSEKQFSKAKAL